MLAFFDPYFQDIDLKKIINDVTGAAAPNDLHNLIAKLALSYCHSNIEEYLFLEPSAGVVFGLKLNSGDKVVLKVFNKQIKHDYLIKMNQIQKIFCDEKFPAPMVLSPIFSFNHTNAGFYEFIEGKRENGHDAEIRMQLAKHLARFSELVDKHAFEPLQTFMQESMSNQLWPIPHNVLFDFEKTNEGAEWITEKATQAKKLLREYPIQKKLAHTDWGVRNILFKNRIISGVFDWDALGTMSEPEMVGSAAAQFTADWESANKITPTPEEGRLFIQEYEKYRGRGFTTEELQIASAAGDYVICLISRFEHAGGNPDIHPYQDLLKTCINKSFLFC